MSETIVAPVARAQMLIRASASRVFQAVVDPTVTSRFWFTRGSGRLEPGKTVRWEWEMYGVGTDVRVKEVEQDRRILVEWNGPENPTLVEWTLEPRSRERTLVTVKNWGFSGDPDKVVHEALDATGGFNLVLAAMKAYLEHDIALNVVLDHDPDAIVAGWNART